MSHARFTLSFGTDFIFENVTRGLLPVTVKSNETRVLRLRIREER